MNAVKGIPMMRTLFCVTVSNVKKITVETVLQCNWNVKVVGMGYAVDVSTSKNVINVREHYVECV